MSGEPTSSLNCGPALCVGKSPHVEISNTGRSPLGRSLVWPLVTSIPVKARYFRHAGVGLYKGLGLQPRRLAVLTLLTVQKIGGQA